MTWLGLGMGLMQNVAATSGGVAASTWNPADKNSNITLSSGNLLATLSDAGGNQIVRGTLSHSTGKYYAEFVVHFTSSLLVQVGISDATENLNGYLGLTSDSAGYGSDGIIRGGGSSTSSEPTLADNDRVGIAVDFGAAKAWYYKNGTIISGDPVAGTGGFGIPPGASFLGGSGQHGAITLCPTAASQTFSPPTGYSAWG